LYQYDVWTSLLLLGIMMTYAPGNVRDSIIRYLSALGGSATVAEIHDAVAHQLGNVAASSVRSYLNLNTPDIFERIGRGCYGLATYPPAAEDTMFFEPAFEVGKARFYQADCFEWLANQPPASIQAVITDPPYGLVEYSALEQSKLVNGRGGIWRIPPSFDGHKRAPLPRFTVLDDGDRRALHTFSNGLGPFLNASSCPERTSSSPAMPFSPTSWLRP